MKKALSLLLAVLMFVTLLPVGVWAEEEPEEVQATVTEERTEAIPTPAAEPEPVPEPAEPESEKAPEAPATEPAEVPSVQEAPSEPEPALETEQTAESAEERPAEQNEPAEELPAEQSELPEEPAEEVFDAEIYPWENLSDEDFIAFLYAGKNTAYLTALLLNTETEEYAAFLARVEAIEDEEALVAVQTLLLTLIPEVKAEEAPAEPEGEEAPETAEEPAEELPAEQTEVPEESTELPEELPEEPAEPEPFTASVPTSVTVTDGSAALTVTVSGEYIGKLSYQWQQLDGSVDFSSELARREAWEDIPSAAEAVLTFSGLDEETYASYENMLYRCIVRTSDDAEISTETRLLPAPVWGEGGENEETEPEAQMEEVPVLFAGVADSASCTHPSAEYIGSIEDRENVADNGDSTHTCEKIIRDYYSCPDCGEEYWVEQPCETVTEAHDWYNGICIYCRAVNGCTHPSAEYQSSFEDRETVTDNGDGTHTYDKVLKNKYSCPDCGEEYWIEQPRETVTEAHDWYNGICIYCRAVNGCTHPSTEYQSIFGYRENVTDNGDGTHTYEKIIQYYYTCPDCGEEYRVEQSRETVTEAHDWYNGTCTYCGAVNECTHSSAEYQYDWDSRENGRDNGDGTHTCEKTLFSEFLCPDCGEKYNVERSRETVTEAHDWHNGTCIYCRAVNGCTHPSAEYQSSFEDRETMIDNGDGSHTCGKIIRDYYSCPDCGEEYWVEQPCETVTEAHDWYNGTCIYCRAVNGCTHPSAEYQSSFEDRETMIDNGDGSHTCGKIIRDYYSCPDCGEEYWVEQPCETVTEAHDWYNGTCIYCRAVNGCTHPSTEYQSTFVYRENVTDNGNDTHTYEKIIQYYYSCPDCGEEYRVEQPRETVTEAHDWYSGTCWVCDAINSCPHFSAEYQYDWENFENGTDNGDGTHTYEKTVLIDYHCPDCGEEYSAEQSRETVTEAHDWYNGTCTYCGAVNECTHSSAEYRYDWDSRENGRDNGDGTHTCEKILFFEFLCPDCGEEYSVEQSRETVTETHDWHNGTCTYCDVVNDCTHSSVEYQYDWEDFENGRDNGDGTHTCEKILFFEFLCPDCGEEYSVEQSREMVTEAHDWSLGRCNYCGALNACIEYSVQLNRKYLLLKEGETVELTAAVVPENYTRRVVWETESSECITVENGNVTALSKGTGYVKVSMTVNGQEYFARCRVDVVTDEQETTPAPAGEPAPTPAPEEVPHPIAAQITGVQLVTTSVTSKIYSETYARVSFLPLIQQNLKPLSEEEGGIENNGAAVENAELANANAAGYFDLRVADDRTLEIIPKTELIADALAGKKLPVYYTSKIIFTIDGQEFTSNTSLKLTLSKVKPAVKAKAITLNKYAAVLGDPYAITFTGGTVTEITNVTGVPAWLDVDTENRTLALSTETIPAKYTSGTAKFTCTVEGWKAPVTVSQKYSVKSTAPSLKFGTKSVTLLQGSPDAVDVKLTVTPAAYADGERFPVTFVQLTKLVGKKYVPIDNEIELYVTCENGLLKLRAPEKAPDGKAHTYKATLSVAEKNFTYTIKTTAPVAASFTVKAGGTINSRIANSPATLTVTPKNFHAGIGEAYTVEKVQQYKGKTLVNDNVQQEGSELFDIRQEGNVFTFTEKTLGTIVSGNTYKAVIAVDIDGDGAADGSTAASLKTAFPKTVPAISVSVKVTGSLDITRPGNAMILTGSVKNWFGDVTWSRQFYKKVGRKTVAITKQEEIDVLPFNIQQEGNVFTVTVKPGTAATSAYSVKLVASANGKDYLTASKTLSVKKGKVTVKQSVKSGILYKKDRYSEIVIDLSIADTTVAPIARVALDAASSKKFDLTDLGNGRYALGYLNDTLPASFKASTAKLLVYLEGMPETVSAATVSLKVSYK